MESRAEGAVVPSVLMTVNQAREVLGVTANALKDRVRSGSLRGWAPGDGPNRTKRWLFAWEDVARLAEEKGLVCPGPDDGSRAAGGGAALGQAQAENADLRVGFELAQAEAVVARQDLTRAEVSSLRTEVERLRRENAALRAAVRQLAAPDLD